MPNEHGMWGEYEGPPFIIDDGSEPRGPWSPFNDDGTLKDLKAEGWHYLGAMKDEA